MGVSIEDITKTAQRGVVTSLGFGVLLVQHARVQRRLVLQTSARVLQDLGTVVEDKVKMFEERLSELDERARNANNKN